jgi:hypothetical protein
VLTVCPAGPPACLFRKIQEAIDAAPEDLSSPRPKPPITKIAVGPGTYEENLIVRKSLVLEGVSRDQVLLRPSSKEGQERWVGIQIVANVGGVIAEISGFHIQQVGLGNIAGIMVVGSFTFTRLYQNRLENENGIYLDGAPVNTIEDNEFLASKDASLCFAIFGGPILTLQIQKNTFNWCTISIGGARWNPYGRELKEPGERVLIENNVDVGTIYIADSAAIAIRKNNTLDINLLKGVEQV